MAVNSVLNRQRLDCIASNFNHNLVHITLDPQDGLFVLSLARCCGLLLGHQVLLNKHLTQPWQSGSWSWNRRRAHWRYVSHLLSGLESHNP